MKTCEERCPEITYTFTSQDSPRTVKSKNDSVLLLSPMLERRKQAFRNLNLKTATLAHELDLTLLNFIDIKKPNSHYDLR
jgi:hypothetical protein